jgi:hypothetical protein
MYICNKVNTLNKRYIMELKSKIEEILKEYGCIRKGGKPWG